MAAASCGMANSATSRPWGIDQHDRGGVVDEVGAVVVRLVAEVRRPDVPGEPRELAVASGHAEELRSERRHVPGEVSHRVPGRIDGHQHVLPGHRGIRGEVVLDPAQGGKGARADVRAVGCSRRT